MLEASVRDPNRWRQIELVFNEAVELDPSMRASFIERACGTDQELRREVESLLASLDGSAPFIQSAVEDAAAYYLNRQLPAPLAEGSFLAHYRIVHLLGSGGMGLVYLAEDTRLKRNVALKLLPNHALQDPLLRRRFEREARVLCSLNHPNLLTIFDFCTDDDQSFLVTELVEGQTLREKLNSGPIDLESTLHIARQIGLALKAAHAAGVIHRDIKPENIMIRTDGCVKLLDFGIAKLTDAGQIHQNLTIDHRSGDGGAKGVDGSLLGTPRYMSPEQARATPVDARTDIFSLGAVLYEMLAGRPAFDGNTSSDLIADILRGHPQPLVHNVTGRGVALQPVVDRCLMKDPAERYQTADDVLVDIEKFQKLQHLTQGHRSLYVRLLQLALLVTISLLVALAIHHRREHAAEAAHAPRSLAVLPFRNLKPGSDTDFLSFSLADEVITKLGYLRALIIRPSSAIARYRDSGTQDQNLSLIASSLNAQFLLTGTYLRDGDKLRITTRLIGFSPEAVLWQNTWTLKYGDLLSVQDEVAQMIIQSLELQLGPDEKALMKPDHAVSNLAYEYYLRGVDLYSVSDFLGAITMLEKSAALDPKYAPTWAHLGRAYTTNASLQFGGRRDYRLAEKAYDNAIALNPVLPEPRVYMANLLTDTGRVEQAVTLLRGALKSSPNNAEAHWELGYAYRFGGMLEESAAECELARRLDPEVKINSSALNTYLYLGEYDKFLNSLPPNDSPYLVFYRGLASYYKHDFANAELEFDRAFDLAPGLFPAQIGKALSYELKHQPEAGLSQLRQTEQSLTAVGVADAEGLYKVAQAYALLGDPRDAVRVLDSSITGGFFCFPYISRDSLLSSLHSSPDFDAAIGKARERWLQFRGRFAGSENH